MSVAIPLLLNVTAGTTGATSAVQSVPSAAQGEDQKNLDIFLSVTAATGGTTPAVQAEVQWSMDGVTFFSADTTKDQFPDNTNTGLQVGAAAVKEFEVKAPYWRVVTTFSGAPTNMTYSVGYRYTA
jgi:hypothetical protein